VKSPIKTFSLAEDQKLRDQAAIIDRRVFMSNRVRKEKEESDRQRRIVRIIENKKI
jgi:hypothetical protein